MWLRESTTHPLGCRERVVVLPRLAVTGASSIAAHADAVGNDPPIHTLSWLVLPVTADGADTLALWASVLVDETTVFVVLFPVVPPVDLAGFFTAKFLCHGLTITQNFTS